MNTKDGYRIIISTPSPQRYVGKFPIRQDINVLPANAPKDLKLDWIVQEYMGREVLNENGNPLLNYADLKIGATIDCWGIKAIVVDKTLAETTSHLFTLTYEADDRERWICDGMINKRAIKQLELL